MKIEKEMVDSGKDVSDEDDRRVICVRCSGTVLCVKVETSLEYFGLVGRKNLARKRVKVRIAYISVDIRVSL